MEDGPINGDGSIPAAVNTVPDSGINGDKSVEAAADDADEQMASLKANLKVCDPQVQNHVAALEAQNRKLRAENRKLKAENSSLKTRIEFLVKQNEKNKGKPLTQILAGAGAQLEKAREINRQRRQQKLKLVVPPEEG